MVNDHIVIQGSSSEFDLVTNDKLWETNIKISEPEPEEDENFWIGVTMTADNQVFELPVRGYNFTSYQNVPYDWLIDYGDGTVIEHAVGTGSSSGLVTGHTYATAGYYVIKVIPGSDIFDYGWARAFGCSSAAATNTKPFITNGGKFTWMSLAESDTSSGNYFSVMKYYGCNALTVPEDTSGWSISGSQGSMFNYSKYQDCVILTVPENTSGWSISGSQGNYFNTSKYQGCSELIIHEDTSNWSISGEQELNFNSNKYSRCSKLTFPEDTSNWTISGIQGGYFDGNKYLDCSSLIVPENTSGWSISGNQGTNFNRSKYQGCTVLSSLEDWSGFGTIGSTALSVTSYLCYRMYYLDNPNTTLIGDTTMMRSKFPSAAQDNPPFAIATFHNRTGLLNYDTLGDNWK